MNDPLNAINAEEVEKNVSEAFKTMHKSVRFFQEMPSECSLQFADFFRELYFTKDVNLLNFNHDSIVI